MTYVALLRGINVGGRIIKMADLRACFNSMGFTDVKTVLQSGNVVFVSGEDSVKLRQKIEASLREMFHYPAKVWVLGIEEIKDTLATNPFDGAPQDYHQYVIFFEDDLYKNFAAEVIDSEDEAVHAGPRVVYWKVRKRPDAQKPAR